MPISKTFACKKHGEFDAFLMNSEDKVRCPIYGCRGKPRELPSGPSLFSDHTKGCDRTLDGLAKDFKMTDIKSTREGEAQPNYISRNNAPAPVPTRSSVWQPMGARSAVNVTPSIRGERIGINPQEAGVSRGPTPDPRSTFRDHENLKISK